MIAEAGVVGVPLEIKGQGALAFVVSDLDDNSTLADPSVVDHLRANRPHRETA
nr:hypothetical protein [Novosphingobium colocasiae]